MGAGWRASRRGGQDADRGPSSTSPPGAAPTAEPGGRGSAIDLPPARRYPQARCKSPWPSLTRADRGSTPPWPPGAERGFAPRRRGVARLSGRAGGPGPPAETLASWHHRAVGDSPGPILVTDREGRVRGGNRASLTLFGRGSLGGHAGSLCPPAQATRLAEWTDRVLGGEVLEGIDLEVRLPDGSARLMLAHLYPLRGRTAGLGGASSPARTSPSVSERPRRWRSVTARTRRS